MWSDWRLSLCWFAMHSNRHVLKTIKYILHCSSWFCRRCWMFLHKMQRSFRCGVSWYLERSGWYAWHKSTVHIPSWCSGADYFPVCTCLLLGSSPPSNKQAHTKRLINSRDAAPPKKNIPDTFVLFRNTIQCIEMPRARSTNVDSYVTCNNKTRVYLMHMPSETR